MLKEGLVHIYYGEGKGKTSSAIGLGIRAYGAGLKVCMIQFLKSWKTSEIEALESFYPDFRIIRLESIKGFINELNNQQIELLKAEICEELKFIETAFANYDVLILDEILGVLENGFITIQELKKIILNKPEKVELVLTGRILPEQLISFADYVTELKMIKHPIDTGKAARKGIEY